MSDIVINHASIKSKYFKNFIENKDDTKNFFIKLKNVQEVQIYLKSMQSMTKLFIYGAHLVMIRLILILKTPRFFFSLLN